ncbi:PQQ-dependent dehydrogenase, methanol/ethanol family [Vitreimonas flagellata]|uniref:PQQ-dependent dehydrogenase, methanol/ethanol family n=1 Tax=Vitreimonas flagellata TaxID=2560861 RepID=UPI001074DD18|nr:PQQ-dependent dehydrogenase, methanol/ethanol family [Vitreimonas flagellata]
MRRMAVAFATGVALALVACGPSGPAAVSEARIVGADSEPGNWMSHGRTYSEDRFSPLTDINAGNVSQLGLAWTYEMRMPRGAEATPIVVDGIMYVTSAWSIVYALNAATGEELWVFDPEVPHERGASACCDVGNRGVAVWNGKVYVGTLDGRLIALNARDGSKAWEVVTVDQSRPYTITGAPRAARGLIYIGNGGAEFGVRGYVSAYDAESGDLRWRFYTTPNPTEADNAASDSVRDTALATWNPTAGAWLESGGGGTAWDALVYDNETDTLWIGVGNGSPWNRDIRSPNIEGRNNDNLFLSSVVGVDPDTGEYKCHYQETPGETWDYTATQPIILSTLQIAGQERRVLMHAPKNGFFYVIDRDDCGLISAGSIATQTWASGVDMSTGRPIENAEARYASGTAIVLPSPFGAHNWHPMSMSRDTGLVYIPVQELAQDYTADPAFVYRPGRWNTGTVHAALPTDRATRAAIRNTMNGFLLAWDPVNQREAWRVPLGTPWNGGTLATAGNLVFQGTLNGRFRAYNARTGDQLWDYDNQAATMGGPITYEVDGVQYVASLASYGTLWFLPVGFGIADPPSEPVNARVNVFRIGGTATLPTRELVRLPMERPPTLRVSQATIARGSAAYGAFCGVCHGSGATSGGVLPDLRRAPSLQDANVWRDTVHGARAANGMPDFTQWVSVSDAEAIRAYVASEAQVLYAEERARPN